MSLEIEDAPSPNGSEPATPWLAAMLPQRSMAYA